jgi:hypothetical protein
MDMVVVFEWLGQIRAAEQAHEPRQREIWTRWAVLGGSPPSRGKQSTVTGLEPPQGSREPEINPMRPTGGELLLWMKP